MGNCVIFYPNTKSGTELKESVERYLWYVNKEQVIDEVPLIPERYFDLIYPKRYEGKKLYFIFDEEPYEAENININHTGLLLCALYELKIHNFEELYVLNFQKEVFKLSGFPGRENEHPSQDKNQNISTQASKTHNKECQSIFAKYDDKGQKVEIKEYGIAHGHREISDILPNILIKILISMQKSNAVQSKSTSEPNVTQEQNKFIHILIIDDVIGDYSKKFFPFYVWLKKEFIDNKIMAVIRGIPCPDKLVEYLRLYPFDVVLIDIDFSKYFEKNVKKNKGGEKIKFDKTSYYYRIIEEIMVDIHKEQEMEKQINEKDSIYEKTTKGGKAEKEIEELINEKGPIIMGFIILEQLISLLRTGISEINDKKNCNWYILTSYPQSVINDKVKIEEMSKKIAEKPDGEANNKQKITEAKDYLEEKLNLLKERWIEKKHLINHFLKTFEKIQILLKEEEGLRKILKCILASKYDNLNQKDNLNIIKAFGISVKSEKELLEEAKEIKENQDKIKKEAANVYTGEEELDENDFIMHILNERKGNDK